MNILPKEINPMKESVERYQNLIEASSDPLITLNPKGKITDTNQATVKVTGISRENLIGSDFFQYFTEPKKAKEAFQQVFSDGYVIDYCLIIRHKDGGLSNLLFNGSVYKDARGKVLGLVASMREIVKFQKSYPDLLITEEQIGHLAAIVESSDDAIISKSLDGTIKSWNKAAEKIFGYTFKETIGKHVSLIIPKEYLAEEKEIVGKILNNETLEHYETVRKRKNGEHFPVSLTVSPLKDQKGNIIGVSKIARDITEKKKATYARSLIEASLDPLVTISTSGKIMDFNEALTLITGCTRERLKGSDFFSYFTQPQKAREVYQDIFAKGSVADSPLTLLHANGKHTDVLFNGSVYKDDNGQVLGAVVVARDIAEQKWASELRNVNKELAFQNLEKEKRADELVIANKELAFQNREKENRANELGVANKELAFQNDEKEKRSDELIIANKELAFQNNEKEKRADELSLANIELAFQNKEKGKRADELGIANKELAFQHGEKEKRAQELGVANKELAFQNNEKEKRAAELAVANTELAFQNDEKEKRAAELGIANTELAFQNNEKEKRAAELIIANKELAFQNDEKVKRAAELRVANYARGLIEASRDPLVTISPEGKITDTNEATVKITGIKRKKLIGSDFFDYFTEPQMAREVYQEVFAKGSVADSPLTLRHKGGKLTDVLFNGSVYKNDQGEVLGVVIVARDVTDQKRIATELNEARLSAERATALAEEAKKKAESATEIAEDAVKSKQQFLSNMSHEIRTPMSAIIGFTKVLLKTELTAKQREYLDAIKTSGDALIVLINDILDLAKVDAGKMVFEQTPFKMAASISAMLHLFETKIQEKNLELVKEYDSNIPEVLVGDPVRLHQIILNLVSNAVKFTTNGKITVKVRMLVQDDEKVIIEFSVTDTGIGIEPSKQARIFDDFQQATSGTSRLYGGTGLGLAIVKNLVEPQGGTITVQSKVGEGSTFSFILAFKKTKESVDVESGLEVELQSGFKNVRILVVEDIALNQLLLKTLLEEFGFKMDVAANGKIAIEKLRNFKYDIILMDLQMPVMNGFETTEYIRNKLNLNIPIIALTADVTTVDVEKCKAVGMNDYISKPIDDKLLYNKIIKYLKRPNEGNRQILKNAQDLQTRQIKCVNFEYLKRITKNDSRMVQMIKLYLQEIPQLVKAMKQAIKEKDWETLKISTHSIVPTFATMGINPEFEDIAKTIQTMAGNLISTSAGNKVTPETMKIFDSLFLKIETVCNLAAKELEEELLELAKTVKA